MMDGRIPDAMITSSPQVDPNQSAARTVRLAPQLDTGWLAQPGGGIEPWVRIALSSTHTVSGLVIQRSRSEDPDPFVFELLYRSSAIYDDEELWQTYEGGYEKQVGLGPKTLAASYRTY